MKKLTLPTVASATLPFIVVLALLALPQTVPSVSAAAQQMMSCGITKSGWELWRGAGASLPNTRCSYVRATHSQLQKLDGQGNLRRRFRVGVRGQRLKCRMEKWPYIEIICRSRGRYVLLRQTTRTPTPSGSATRAEAVDAVTWAINRRFADVLDLADGRPVRCGKRVSLLKFRCRIGFVMGDSAFWGRSLTRGRAGGTVRVRIQLSRLDEYCLYVRKQPRQKCVKRYRWRTSW